MLINGDYTRSTLPRRFSQRVGSRRATLRINRRHCQCRRVPAFLRLSGVSPIAVATRDWSSRNTRGLEFTVLHSRPCSRGNISCLIQGSSEINVRPAGLYDRRYSPLSLSLSSRFSRRGLLIPFRYREWAFISLLRTRAPCIDARDLRLTLLLTHRLHS
jgi:hypothetical protein